MKNITLCLALTCYSCLLIAQTVKPDSTFGGTGQIETNLADKNLNPYGYNLALLPNGEVVIVGAPYEDSLGAKKYRNDGTLDAGFTTILGGFAQNHFGASLQKDGKAIVSGYLSKAPFYSAVARLNLNGGMDASFGNNGIASVFLRHAYETNLLELANEKIIIFGSEDINNSNIPTVVTRLNANGTIDSSFGINGTFRRDILNGPEFIPAGVEQADGKLLFAGMVNYRLLLLRLNPDGTLDSTFSEDGILINPMPLVSEAYCIHLQTDEKIIVGGYSDPSYKPIIARFNPNGTPDSTFGDAGIHNFADLSEGQEGVGIVVLPNGKIIMLLADLAEDVVRLAQLLPNGQRDLSFGINGIYQHTGANLRSRSLRLNGNKLTISGRNEDTDQIFLLRLLLELNVGTLNPNTPAEPSLWVYPNPITNQFTLKFGLSQKEPVNIHLFDMNGKQVQSFVQNQSFEPGEHDLNFTCVNFLPAGNYVLTFEVAGKKRTSIQILKK